LRFLNTIIFEALKKEGILKVKSYLQKVEPFYNKNISSISAFSVKEIKYVYNLGYIPFKSKNINN